MVIKKGLEGNTNKVLVGKRKGSHAAGLYSFPGGHLDFGETWEQAVLREKDEECGEQFKVEILDFGQPVWSKPDDTFVLPFVRTELFITNDIMPQYGKHYITIYMVAEWVEGEPENMEPHKNEGWEWKTFDELQILAENESTAEWIPINKIEQFRYTIGL